MQKRGLGKRRLPSGVPEARPVESGREFGSRELIQRCLRQEDAAWGEFLRRYADLIYTTIRTRVELDREDCEDAFQNAVLAIYRNLGDLRDPDRLAGWVVRIAYFQGVNRIRTRARLQETTVEDPYEHAVTNGTAAGEYVPPPVALEERLERAQRARELVDLLPERCRMLIHELFYVDPVPDYSEIAKKIGIPIGSIGPTRARCLAKMRELWEQRGWSD